jgi:hypothetical protein
LALAGTSLTFLLLLRLVKVLFVLLLRDGIGRRFRGSNGFREVDV